MLNDFYEGTTKKFRVRISLNGSKPDIRSDKVQFLLKKVRTDLDENAKIDVNGDVETNGINGEAFFSLTPNETKQEPGEYYYEIIWTLLSGEVYVLDSGKIKIKDRIKDV